MEIFPLNNNNKKPFQFLFILKKVMFHPLGKFVMKSELIISINLHSYSKCLGKKCVTLIPEFLFYQYS